MAPILLVIITINFILVRAAPGDPTLYLIGDAPVSDEYVTVLRERLGLNRNLFEQLIIYLGNTFRGDLGYSYISQEPVATLILSRLPATLLLMGSQYILSIIVGVLLGVISARRQSGKLDIAVTLFSVVGYALPVFWLGQIFVLIFALKLGWFPSQGMISLRFDQTFWQQMFDVLHHLILPASTLALANLALITRLTRANMLQVLRLEYIIFARSKGLSERKVLLRHALRNAILPVVTIIGLNVRTLIAGAVLTETVFSWPGLGRLTYDAIYARDYPVLLGMFMMIGIIVVVSNLVTDITYTRLDPRIRLS